MNKLIKGCTYISNRSGLEVTVISIPYQNKEYCKAKLLITVNGRLMERPKYYKLYWKNIQHWKIK